MRNYRVEFPAMQLDDAVCFDTEIEARDWAYRWAREDRSLVLVWCFASASYIYRFDHR